MTASRRSVTSCEAWESRFGYHRAVAVGDHAWVSGTTAASSGAEPDADVVRTRVYLIDRDDSEAVGGVHSRVFGETHPTASMVVVARLIAPELRVEIELEAFRGVRA